MMTSTLFTLVVAIAAADVRPQILVMPLEHDSHDIPSTLAATVGESIGAEIAREPGFSVLTHDDLSRLAALEGEKQAMGCETDQSCLAEIATALGARFVVSGRLSKVDGRHVLQLTLLDAHGGLALARENATEPNATGVIDRIPALVATLVDAAAATLLTEGVTVERRVVDDTFSFLPVGLVTLGAGAAVLMLAAAATTTGGVLLFGSGLPIALRDSYWLFLTSGAAGIALGVVVVSLGGATAGASVFIE